MPKGWGKKYCIIAACKLSFIRTTGINLYDFVILSEHSESKDLRIIVTLKGIESA